MQERPKSKGRRPIVERCASFYTHTMLSQVVELIEAKRRFAITSHIRPDGDSLGSSLGLYWLLRALDKDVEVIMRDPVPHAYQQLPGANEVRVTPAVDPSYHAVFVIECSDIDRPGLIPDILTLGMFAKGAEVENTVQLVLIGDL